MRIIPLKVNDGIGGRGSQVSCVPKPDSFDYVFSAREQWQRNGEAECLGGLEIDAQFDLRAR
jgi:hypothetical protein